MPSSRSTRTCAARMNAVESYAPSYRVGEVMWGGAVGQVVASRQRRVRRGNVGLARPRLARAGALRRPRLLPATRRSRPCRPRSACSACRAHRVLRPARDRPPAGGRDRLRLGRGRGRRLGGGADREAEGLPRDRQRGLGREGRLARRARLRRGFDYHETTPREALVRGRDRRLLRQRRRRPRSRPRSRRSGRTAASSPAARSRSTTRPRPRPGRATFPGRHEAAAHARASSSSTTTTGSRLPRRDGPVVRDGKIRYRETVVDGIENAPRRSSGMLAGENIGKMLVTRGRRPMSWRCRLFGHKVPKARWFFLTERSSAASAAASACSRLADEVALTGSSPQVHRIHGARGSRLDPGYDINRLKGKTSMSTTPKLVRWPRPGRSRPSGSWRRPAPQGPRSTLTPVPHANAKIAGHVGAEPALAGAAGRRLGAGLESGREPVQRRRRLRLRRKRHLPARAERLRRRRRRRRRSASRSGR